MGTDDTQGPGGRWQRYSGGTRRPTVGKWATISKYGSLSLTAELTKAWPAGVNYLWVDYDAAAKQLRLVPTRKNEPGTLGWRTPKTEHVARLSMMGALRRFGLLVDALRRYPADWVDGCVIIDVANETVLTPRTSPKRPSKTPAAAAADDADHCKVTCTECGRSIDATRIGKQWVLDDHKAPDGEPCDGKTVRIRRGPGVSAFGKARPKVRCAVCGAVKIGVRRGGILMPYLHDGPDGKRCPGAQQAAEAVG